MRVKWYKNLFRFAMVMFCTLISWIGAADLDKFVSFIGSFAWSVPSLLQTCGELITYYLQCSAMLRVSGHVTLQSMCAYSETEDGRHCYDRVRFDRRCVYHNTNCSGSYLLSCNLAFSSTYFIVNG
jgi:hypothetical protein